MDTVCHPIALDLRAVAESIVHVLPSNDDDVDVEFIVVVSPSVPKALLLDETYIHRILMNLLSNGLKFTTSGYVMLKMEYNGSDLCVQVRDTGLGIPPVFLPRLFEPFSQAQTRGSQRGTGLGLSITKQLLEKMDGTISVESHYAENPNSNDRTGTTFTIAIPAKAPPSESSLLGQSIETYTVAMFPQRNPTRQEGQKAAWEHFGFDVVEVDSTSQLSNCPDIKYIWVDVEYLQSNPGCLDVLLNQETAKVLVPFSKQETLYHVPGLLSSSRFVLLPKPLMWHTFQSRIAVSHRSSSDLVDMCPNIPKICSPEVPQIETSNGIATHKEVNILLVEDNPVDFSIPILSLRANSDQINQKLGLKMLTSLGYTVLLASDGDEAITVLLSHDLNIDMILMDQSMPNKDGVTATHEIRQLEAEGKLRRKHAIIAVTAVVNSESRAAFGRAGADDFLSKPLSLGMLEQTLATFLRVE